MVLVVALVVGHLETFSVGLPCVVVSPVVGRWQSLNLLCLGLVWFVGLAHALTLNQMVVIRRLGPCWAVTFALTSAEHLAASFALRCCGVGCVWVCLSHGGGVPHLTAVWGCQQLLVVVAVVEPWCQRRAV